MANPDITKYIKEARKSGDSNEKIRSDLISAGWSLGDVDDAFKEVPAERSENALGTGKPVAETTGEKGFLYYLKSIFRIVTFNGERIDSIAADEKALVWAFVFSLPYGILGVLIPSSLLSLIAKIFFGKGKAIDFFKVYSFSALPFFILSISLVLLSFFSALAELLAQFLVLIWAFLLNIKMLKHVFKFGYVRATIVAIIPFSIVFILFFFIVSSALFSVLYGGI